VKKLDPLALIFFGAALALLAGLLLYVLVLKTPEKAVPAQAPGGPGLVELLRGFVAGLSEKFAEKPAAAPPAKQAPQPPPVASVPAPSAKPVAKPGAKAAPAPAGTPVLEAGRTWRYVAAVEPPVWRDITLTYRTQREAAGIGVLTDFVHAGGKMNFHLGTFAADHPSHANTRFPGFFMYAAYLRRPLAVGQAVSFGWHWQGKSAGSMKRFEGQVTGWEDLQLPFGKVNAAKVEGTLTYREDGQFRGGARETFWYAPTVSQVVRIVRDGRTPDEASRRIVAELSEYR
jgi:hypothetical protein